MRHEFMISTIAVTVFTMPYVFEAKMKQDLENLFCNKSSEALENFSPESPR